MFPFFITNLGKNFNLQIDWGQGRLIGPKTLIKTTKAVAREHEEEAYYMCKTALDSTEEMRKTTVAQKMAKKYKEENKGMAKDIAIPTEYRRHTKVFSEKEVERFPPSRE